MGLEATGVSRATEAGRTLAFEDCTLAFGHISARPCMGPNTLRDAPLLEKDQTCVPSSIRACRYIVHLVRLRGGYAAACDLPEEERDAHQNARKRAGLLSSLVLSEGQGADAEAYHHVGASNDRDHRDQCALLGERAEI